MVFFQITFLIRLRESVEELKENTGKLHTFHCDLYNKAINVYNKAICLARKDYFSKVITENDGNPRILFSTTDKLLNSTLPVHCSLHQKVKILHCSLVTK